MGVRFTAAATVPVGYDAIANPWRKADHNKSHERQDRSVLRTKNIRMDRWNEWEVWQVIDRLSLGSVTSIAEVNQVGELALIWLT